MMLTPNHPLQRTHRKRRIAERERYTASADAPRHCLRDDRYGPEVVSTTALLATTCRALVANQQADQHVRADIAHGDLHARGTWAL
jgi:hypothetical protein